MRAPVEQGVGVVERPELRDCAARYAAVQRLSDFDALVADGTIYPRWIAGSHSFWYDRDTQAGIEDRAVDADSGASGVLVSRPELVPRSLTLRATRLIRTSSSSATPWR